MNKKISYLACATVLLFVNSVSVQASVVTYNITGEFVEPVAKHNTIFNGSFEWDGSSISSFYGTMNSSMYDTNNINPVPGDSFPLINLGSMFVQSTGVDGKTITASVFKENSSNVFWGGGYQTGDAIKLGETQNVPGIGVFPDSFDENDNAYFSFSFDKTTIVGLLDSIVYGDCTPGGMMGKICMTGHNLPGGGTMAATPLSLEISAVPVPAAVWLFGSSLLGMIGVSRKRTLSV